MRKMQVVRIMSLLCIISFALGGCTQENSVVQVVESESETESETNILNSFSSEIDLWEYLEATYPTVTKDDIAAGNYADSYAILDSVAQNVSNLTNSKYVSCDMYFLKSNGSYEKNSIWGTGYSDDDLKRKECVNGQECLENLQDGDLLRGCYYINSDNSFGADFLAIKKTGVADASVELTEELVFNFSSSVKNDITGKWRLATINTSLDTVEYALDYYKTYFDSDDEIHAIINYTNKTTSCVSVIGAELNVTVHEYVDGEENDAKILFSGNLIADYYINFESGEISLIS